MNENDFLTKDNGQVVSFFQSLERTLDGIENLTKNYRPTLGGERFLTDKEVSEKLKLSRRSLQDYRNEGRIPYIKLGGKILYRSSDVDKLLDEGYRGKFK
ncbi:MAG: helix-turn-helix domain-containing protein [Odoribacter sp.]|nr:helix-turn-helix domain-containing protein [Odoribacter sp.]